MKKRRQTMEKFRREQAVRQRRADKLQKKEAARIAKAFGVDGQPTGLPGPEAANAEGQDGTS